MASSKKSKRKVSWGDFFRSVGSAFISFRRGREVERQEIVARIAPDPEALSESTAATVPEIKSEIPVGWPSVRVFAASLLEYNQPLARDLISARLRATGWLPQWVEMAAEKLHQQLANRLASGKAVPLNRLELEVRCTLAISFEPLLSEPNEVWRATPEFSCCWKETSPRSP